MKKIILIIYLSFDIKLLIHKYDVRISFLKSFQVHPLFLYGLGIPKIVIRIDQYQGF